MTRQQRKQYERDFLRYSAAAEQRYIGPIAFALNLQTKPVIDHAEQYGIMAALLSVDALVPADPIEKVIRRIYVGEGQKSARREYAWLNSLYGKYYVKSAYSKDFPVFSGWLEIMQAFFLSFGAEAVVRITDTTKEEIKQTLNLAMENQWTIPEIRDQLTGMEGINRRRANVIARTEIISSLNHGSDVAARQAPILFVKEWLSTLDKRTRRTHVQLNGETQEMDDPFSNGGMYPGDPTLSAKERIQCRCTKIHIAKLDANGNIILKVAR